LPQTIRSCFENAAGEVEVVVCLDGYWHPGWKELTDQFPNLHTIHHGEPRGLRAAINSAAGSAISRGAKYLLKLDAHCMLDEGYDTKLQDDMESNWIVVPRRKRLNAETWTVQDVGKPDVDYHYLSFPDDPQDFGGKGLNGKVWYERIKERLDKPEYDLDDEMSSQGSCWFMAASYFQELELMDEASYGPFWNEFQELGLKCWLSGGQVKINKKTFYAHLHKGREYKGEDGKGGRGYHLPESWLTQGATFTKEWIWNDAWSKQTLPFKWLIDHFWPVPSWPENWEEVLYAERKPCVIQGYEIGVDVASGEDRTMVHDGQGNLTKGLVIIAATYGIDAGHGPGANLDVTARLQNLAYLNNDSLDIVVNNSTLCPGENPHRGKKKTLWVTYFYDGGEPVTIQREEKDWLIIGQVRPSGEQTPIWKPKNEPETSVIDFTVPVVDDDDPRLKQFGHSLVQPDGSIKTTNATALNDYLIRHFSISPQRLRGPMPIELRDFHRNDLAQLFAELGFKRGAEIGVAEGKYSEVLLKANPECELLLVDIWSGYAGNPQNKPNDKHLFAYNETVRKTKEYEHVDIRQGYSLDVVDGILYNSLDFCYVDANHLFDECVQDIIEWSKRVRSGGIVSGDDYYALDQKRWIGGGVVEAVQAYTNAHRIPVWYLFSGHKSVDFMWVKP